MARSQIDKISEELQDDSGAVLFSIVQGEQFEFPVTLSFVQNASIGYTYECAIIEGLNIVGQTVPPVVAKPGGVNEQLTVFVPLWRSTWNGSSSYSRDDLVEYSGLYYIRNTGAYVVDATSPNLSSSWTVYTPNTVYIRFPDTLSFNWEVSPNTNSNIYGFIELRVTEPGGTRYTRTWKPMRGLIEFLYSPTKLVN